ncbi:class I SAM-dependent methyltransferase [Luteimonas pelagia]
MTARVAFADHFSAVAADYAGARPDYPDALFDWIAAIAPGRALAWEAGCGSGQATADLATRFDRVHATDPSVAQVAQARGPSNVRFVVERAEACSLADGSADVACVAQALHWFDRDAYFAGCDRVLRPGGVLVAWGYGDVVVSASLRAANDAFQRDIRAHWPAERALVDAAYAGFAWPFERVDAPAFAMTARWPLSRLLRYFASYSASRRCRDATGHDPVEAHRATFEAAWPDAAVPVDVRWPLFVHARSKGTA